MMETKSERSQPMAVKSKEINNLKSVPSDLAAA